VSFGTLSLNDWNNIASTLRVLQRSLIIHKCSLHVEQKHLNSPKAFQQIIKIIEIERIYVPVS